MKTTTVPAQVTTVEDKIAGNLNASQLFLLAMSLFSGFGLYLLFPPSMKITIPKVLLCSLAMLFFASLAIRIRGQILARWLVVIVRYNLRPSLYVYNKNDLYLRDVPVATEDVTETSEKKAHNPLVTIPDVSIPVTRLVELEHSLSDPRSALAFETNKKGGLDVRITEIK